MKISQHKNSEFVNFSDLEIGAIFQDRNHVYIKIKTIEEAIPDGNPMIRNAIRLSQGYCSTFDDDDKVCSFPEAVLYLRG